MSYWNQHLCQRLVPITTGWWLQTTERDESADRLRKFGWKIQKNTTVWNHPMHCPPSLLGYIGMSGNKLGGSFEVEHSLDSHRVIVPVSFGGPSDPRLARALARKFAQQLPGSCRGPVCGSQLVPICSVAIRSLWLALVIDVKWCKSLRRSKNLGTSWYILVPMEKSRKLLRLRYWLSRSQRTLWIFHGSIVGRLWKCPFGPQNRNLVLFICISSGISRMNSIDFEMLPWPIVPHSGISLDSIPFGVGLSALCLLLLHNWFLYLRMQDAGSNLAWILHEC